MPIDNQERIYKENFPFGKKRISVPSKKINKYLHEAHKESKKIKNKYSNKYTKKRNSFKRIRIEDSILKFGDPMYYKFMPSLSKTLNTAPVYSSEIPETLKKIFSDTPGIKEKKFLRYHPEMNPIFMAYKESTWDSSKGDVGKLYDYINQTTIFPHKNDNKVFKEIMAEEGSKTPRVFLARKVVKLNSHIDEYNYLKNVLSNDGLLTEQITSSDCNFHELEQNPEDKLRLKYNIEFKKDQPEHIVLIVNSNQNAYLAFLDMWSKGWKAYVDGNKTDIFIGYMGTRFIVLKKGKHIVEFKFRVPGLMITSAVSISAWFLVLVSFFVLKLQNRN